MPGRKSKNVLRLGVGAVGTVMTRMLHHRAYVCQAKPNAPANDKIEGAVVMGRQQRVVNRRPQMCLLLSHPAFNQEVYCVERWFNITSEGSHDGFFETAATVTEAAPATQTSEEEAGPPAPPELSAAFERTADGQPLVDEDIDALRNQGIEVDDDNEPLPENIRTRGEDGPPSIMKEWGKPTTCPRRSGGHDN